MGASGGRVDLLRLWDKSGRAARNRILERLIESCSAMTADQLEAELDNTASLLLARISSWLRLTYALGEPMALQLTAIGIFLRAAGSRRFLTEFLEVGGVETVVDILSMSGLTNNDKAAAIELLMSVAEAGRRYKELICDAGGILRVADFMRLPHASETILASAGSLLLSLGLDNPRFAKAVRGSLLGLLSFEHSITKQVACSTLRQLLLAVPADAVPDDVNGDFVEASLCLLQTSNIQVLHEADNLFEAISALPALQGAMLHALMDCFCELPGKKPGDEKPRSHPTCMKASAARALSSLLEKMPSDEREYHLSSLKVANWLAILLTQRDAIDCQRASVHALRVLSSVSASLKQEIQELLGERLSRSIMSSVTEDRVVPLLEEDELDVVLTRLRHFIRSQSALASERQKAQEVRINTDDAREVDSEDDRSPLPS